MNNSLSIRAYTKQLQSHVHHNHHQLVLPVQGSIVIDMVSYTGKVTVGECVVVPSGTEHGFKADEAARFMVADLATLPAHLLESGLAVFSISPPLMSFLLFVEKQLQHQIDSGIEHSILDVFSMLLSQQRAMHTLDKQMRIVQGWINEHLEQPMSIDTLSALACLSPTQFKKRFKASFSMSAQQYITGLRMEKAKALLAHTDLPVQLVAEKVGYGDLSAFSRRFSVYTGLSPRAFAQT
ncbi:transcriptional regulator, AraC family [Paraglaciecola sp. T6c]|uniref:AraC family transcriptional regulator n=1 Tax=Pseudoalteromonas atlantica (strain T6c / ATCC BAA-1087) TaxID=3042615 RepID=UPI00005C592A|nr:AraC family transcriptional regulator [Paraglaciecola sp. T6c]ABG39301.1 transcriptional regulator, AraC family [Paraglaciecola sp. T6c]